MSAGAVSLLALGLEWGRPWGLMALVLPLLVLLWSLRSEPLREEPTGAFRLWVELGGVRQLSEARKRRGLPPGTLWLLLALVATSLALAGPRSSHLTTEERWDVVLDRSPSMYLPLEPSGGEARIESAVREARAWLAVRGVSPEACTWIDGASGGRLAFGELESLLDEPRRAQPGPAWARFDAPGRLLVTDRAPGLDLEHASWLAVGGAAIPGRVDRALEWDGERLATVQPTALLVVAEGLPAELQQLLAIWCDARGFQLSAEWSTAAELRVVGRAAEGAAVRRAGRDGWWISGGWSRPADEALDELEDWLPEGDVRTRPGLVLVGLSEVHELGGDPGALAASWAALFDRTLATPAGVVPLAERRAAGGAGEHLGEAPVAQAAAQDERPVEAWLLVLAAAAGGVWWVRKRVAPKAASFAAHARAGE